MEEPGFQANQLWIEKAAERLRFNRLSNLLLGTDRAGPYLLILTVVVIHLPVLSLIGWTQTGTLSIAVNSGEIFQIPAWVAAVGIMLRVKKRYEKAVTDLPDTVENDLKDIRIDRDLTIRVMSLLGVPENPGSKAEADFETIAPDRLKISILVVALIVYWQQLLFNPEPLIGPVIELTGGLVAGIRFYLVIPFILYPIASESIALVIGVLVLFPFKIRQAKIIDFSDPHGFAGLAPAGELFKSVAVTYFLLLTVFTTFQTVARGTNPSTLFASLIILSGLGLGLVLFFVPMIWMKTYLSRAKKREIEAIADRTREIGSTDTAFPYVEPETEDEAIQYTYDHIRMTRIEMTSNFPLNVGMLWEVMSALILPYVTSVVFDYLINMA